MHKINKLIRVAGMKRNGNHGIVNWILAQHRGNAVFRNAVMNYENLGTPKSDPIEAFRETPGLVQVNLDTPCDKEIVLMTYEDHPVEKALHEATLELYSQRTNHEINRLVSLVILRDPFNFFASRLQAELNGTYPLKSWGDCFSQGDGEKLWAKWKAYANCFQAFEKDPSPDHIAVSYNRWVSSKTYREDLCRQLGVPLQADHARKTVTGWGAGSSFDRRRWQQSERYLSRWEVHREHPAFLEALQDDELISLARDIFGGSGCFAELLEN